MIVVRLEKSPEDLFKPNAVLIPNHFQRSLGDVCQLTGQFINHHTQATD